MGPLENLVRDGRRVKAHVGAQEALQISTGNFDITIGIQEKKDGLAEISIGSTNRKTGGSMQTSLIVYAGHSFLLRVPGPGKESVLVTLAKDL